MIRFVVLLALLFVTSTGSLAAPRMSVGGSVTLGYTCTNESGETPTCTCSGYFDCRAMIGAKVCKRGIESCSTDTKTNSETCSCTW